MLPDIIIPKGAVVTLHTGAFNRVIVEGELMPPDCRGLSIEVLEIRPGGMIGKSKSMSGMVEMKQRAIIKAVKFGWGEPIISPTNLPQETPPAPRL